MKREITLSCIVDNYRSGWTVVEFLSHRFKYHPPERWTARVLDRRVRVNGREVAPSDTVSKDDEISYTIFHAEPEVDSRYDVVYEDGSMLAVSKSGNIPVHACGVYIRNTLISELRARYGNHLSLAHRLDRETSGLVLISKDPVTARALGKMFAEGRVRKAYLAIVRGRVAERRFEVDAPIAKCEETISVGAYGTSKAERGSPRVHPAHLPRRKVDFEKGKPAKTRFVVERHAGEFTVLEAVPLSGRTNQIRVHLNYKGHPVVGDKVYGLDGPLRDDLRAFGLTERVKRALILGRHALHCQTLEFEHPMTKRPLRLDAEVPEDLSRLIDTLES